MLSQIKDRQLENVLYDQEEVTSSIFKYKHNRCLCRVLYEISWWQEIISNCFYVDMEMDLFYFPTQRYL